MKLKRLDLEQFTVFEKTEFNFTEGLNVFIGANGTGKSHLMKLLYAILRSGRRSPGGAAPSAADAPHDSFDNRLARKLASVFRPDDDSIGRLVARKVGKSKAYLTFDIDCLDPSAAPGTGTPIPGGLTYHQAAAIIRKLTNINFVGMDMVEVSPPYDHSEITSGAAAALIMEYVCLRAWQKGARGAVMKV